MSANPEHSEESGDERSERLVALAGLESWLERPMQVLGFVWLASIAIMLA